MFDALFKDYSFASNNPVSQAMQQVLDILQEHRLDKEADTLEKFYASVQMRAEGIDNAQGKQKIVVELYDKFFRNAFPKMTERLGIVYTPVEVVDFIIHSVNELLQQEFNQTLGSKGVHIIDPFTGTGTFIARLLQSGLISKEQLPHKYKNEIHANEIILLAYYIAAINIEAVYHSLVGGEYLPYEGICLTDTFQLYEKDDLISELLVNNSDRRKRQKELDIRVIMANPPYSAGQKSENDNNQNIGYQGLDDRIRQTYAKNSKATLQKGLYDSYIRAIRWASDRVGNSGVVGFVTNAGYLEANTADGLRKCLADEFSSIYIFHLRGNARTQGEQRRKEKDNVFGQGTRTPIAITLYVKNPEAKQHGQIYWHDIGDYLNQDKKLEIIKNFNSINGISAVDGWQQIIPDEYNDWINQRDNSFYEFMKIGDKKDKQSISVFTNYSQGVLSSRDAWVFNFSKKTTKNNVSSMVHFYNKELIRYKIACENPSNEETPVLDGFINANPSKISWSRSVKKDLSKYKNKIFNENNIVQSLYRPYVKQWLYFDRSFNEMIYQMHKLFPLSDISNLAISVSGTGANKGFSAIMIDRVVSFDYVEKAQCYPLYIFEPDECKQDDTDDLFSSKKGGSSTQTYTRKDGISDAGLTHFQAAYPNETISKEDIFYYIYGLLHSQEYRERYADNLTKELPRIPCVKTAKDFWAFSQAGRKLAELHINYETVDCYPVKLDKGIKRLSGADYKVTKMKFAKKTDKSVVVYNHNITIRDIPLEAYGYVVNGKPALEWVMERQAITTDKKSSIVNDANLWATETMGNAKYPLELFQRVITVSLETMKIVNALPKLDID
ncbi:MAG: N-6 DNA methylase [Gammaproteobacteria bacterium]|nr:N-6 DNA methylase [Gammaproteobacteria bacterium]